MFGVAKEKMKKSVASGYEYAIDALEALYDLNITAQEIFKKSNEVAIEYDDCTGPVECYKIKLKQYNKKNFA